MSDEPLTPGGMDAAPSASPPSAPSPAPGDPEYDAFLREVQRLADERQAAQVAGRPNAATRRAVELTVVFIGGAIAIALVVSVLLGVFGDSSIAKVAAVVGLGYLVVAAVWGLRVARTGGSAGD